MANCIDILLYYYQYYFIIIILFVKPSSRLKGSIKGALIWNQGKVPFHPYFCNLFTIAARVLTPLQKVCSPDKVERGC